MVDTVDTTWTVAALAAVDDVLLLGPGWDPVADALVHQGIRVSTDAGDGRSHEAVVLTLDHPGRLEDALRTRPRRVVTRLDADGAGDVPGLVRDWPLALEMERVTDDGWWAAWTIDDTPSLGLAVALTRALASSATGHRAGAHAARAAAEEARRAEANAHRRAGLAEGRARATAALTDRWASTRDGLEDALRETARARADGPREARTRTDATGRALAGPRRLLHLRRSGPETEADPDGRATPAGVLHGVPGPGWRVAVVGGAAASWLGGWVDVTVLDPDNLPLGALVDADDHLDVLVLGRVDAPHRPDAARLADEARHADVQVVGVADGGIPWRGFTDLCDVVVGDDPDRSGPRLVTTPAPVAPHQVNPVGFRARTDGLVTLVTGSVRDLGEVRRAVATHGVESELRGAGTDRQLPTDPAALARQLRPTRGVLDVPEAHDSHAEHARTLVGLAAAGVPIIAPALPDAVRDLLGPALATTISSARLGDLEDVTGRERLSVRQRRAAQWHHTREARWRRLAPALDLVAPTRPPVSVVVVTNRPGHLAHCAGELARQTYRPLEVVLGTHGSAFTRPDVDRFVERTGLPVTAVPIDGHRTLGEGLNQACRRASGEVVVKWDDDDFYGPDHVVDLVLALQYSGATIVGKGSEFVHLDQLDVTIRRFVGNAESGSRSLAGGTLALRRDHLAAAGWWRRVPRAVDQRLLDDVERIGGTVHRTHGFGFVLARHSAGHTWDVGVDYFLAGSEFQWRGLAREAAGLEDQVLASPRSS